MPGPLYPQWLPESARYDVLSGNQEKAIATLKRIATENGAPMPLGKLIISRQVSAWPADCSMHVREHVYVGGPACVSAWLWVYMEWVVVQSPCKGNLATPVCCVFTAKS